MVLGTLAGLVGNILIYGGCALCGLIGAGFYTCCEKLADMEREQKEAALEEKAARRAAREAEAEADRRLYRELRKQVSSSYKKDDANK